MRFNINPKTRAIDNNYSKLGVQGESKIELVEFVSPKIVGQADLSMVDVKCLLNATTASGDNILKVLPVVLDGNNVFVKWEVGTEETAEVGYLKVALHFSTAFGNVFKTLPTTFEVMATINVESEQPVLFSLRQKRSVSLFAVAPEVDEINVIDNKLIIPAKLQNISVQNDNESKKVNIIMPRYYQGEDLSKHLIKLHLQVADGSSEWVSFTPVVVGNDLKLEWTVQRPHTSYAGKLKMQIEVGDITTDTFFKQTEIAEVNVLNSLDGDIPIVPVSPPEFALYLSQIEAVKEQSVAAKDSAAAKANESAQQATLAQGYKAQTQTLRDEVQAIVAGNEAYTKTETLDMFARALETDASGATAQIIHPDPGSDLRLGWYGWTRQEGVDVGDNVNLAAPFSGTGSGIVRTANANGTVSVTGTSTAGIANFIVAQIPAELYSQSPDTMYVQVKTSVATSLNAAVVISYDSSGTEIVSKQFPVNTIALFTKAAAAVRLAICIIVSGGETMNTICSTTCYANNSGEWTPYIEHTGAPSPDNVQEISVGGSGANLLDYTWIKNSGVTRGTAVWQDGKVTLTAIANDCFTGYDAAQWGYRIKVEPSQIFTLSLDRLSDSSAGNGGVFVFSCREDGVPIGNAFVTTNSGKRYSITYTTTANAAYLTVRLGVTNAGKSISYSNMMINSGSTAYPYTLYTGYPYAGVAQAQGVNLLPPPIDRLRLGITTAVNPDGSVTISGTSVAAQYVYLSAIHGTASEFAGDVSFSLKTAVTRMVTLAYRNESDTNLFTNIISGKTSVSATLPPVTTGLHAYVYLTADETINETFSPMLNIGSTALPYTPYIPPLNYALPSPVPLPDGCSVKAGWVDADKMVTFDGSEDWYLSSYGQVGGGYACNVSVGINPMSISNLRKRETKYSDMLTYDGNQYVLFNNNIRVSAIAGVDTIDKFKTHLATLAAAGTPLTVYYQSPAYAGEKMCVWLVEVTKKMVELDGDTVLQSYEVASTGTFAVSFQNKRPFQGISNVLPLVTESPLVGMKNKGFNLWTDSFCYINLFGRASTLEECSAELTRLDSAGTPMTIVYDLATPEHYAIPYTRCPSPDTDTVTLSTPDGTVGARYNKSLSKAIDEIIAAQLASMGLKN